MPNVNENLPWSAQEFLWRQQNANIGDTWTLNSSTVNQIWINYVRNLGNTTESTFDIAERSRFSIQYPRHAILTANYRKRIFHVG